jgi:hypothetical protein
VISDPLNALVLRAISGKKGNWARQHGVAHVTQGTGGGQGRTSTCPKSKAPTARGAEEQKKESDVYLADDKSGR